MVTVKTKVFAILSLLSGLATLLFVLYSTESLFSGSFRFKVDFIYSSAKHAVNYSSTTENISTTTKVILIYTAFFNDQLWSGIPPNLNMTWRGEPCSVQNCEWTYDRKRFPESDLVIFHARNMPKKSHLEMLLQQKHSAQRWAYYLLESPRATPDTKPLNDLFHWTITYRRDSHFWQPYGSYSEHTKTSQTSLPAQDFSKGKDKLVAWVVGNCGAQLRNSFVHKLQEFIQVDVYGGCSSQFGQTRSCPRDCKEVLKKYKFYLGLENALCLDYVTEKYWTHLGEENLIPIVMNDPRWFNEVAIPGSYINVADFKTVKDLAEYLQYLDKNSTAYNEYFQWRLRYKESSNRFAGGLLAPSPWHCHVCEALNSQNISQPKVVDLTDFWVTQAKCGEMDEKLMALF